MRMITRLVLIAATLVTVYAGLVYAVHLIRRAAANDVIAAGHNGVTEYGTMVCNEDGRYCRNVPPELPGTQFVLDMLDPS